MLQTGPLWPCMVLFNDMSNTLHTRNVLSSLPLQTVLFPTWQSTNTASVCPTKIGNIVSKTFSMRILCLYTIQRSSNQPLLIYHLLKIFFAKTLGMDGNGTNHFPFLRDQPDRGAQRRQGGGIEQFLVRWNCSTSAFLFRVIPSSPYKSTLSSYGDEHTQTTFHLPIPTF